MITKERLVELGFTLKSHTLGDYYEKSRICLVHKIGVWVVSSNFGELATGADNIIPYIVTEVNLRDYIKWCGLNDVEFLGL